jgi:hypothetical protein
MDISQDLLRYGKRDNSKAAENAKTRIREMVLAAIGAEQARVFDCFAGEGAMYRAVWHQAAGYIGCDKQWYPQDNRSAYVADNRRVLRAIDLSQFTLFDCDAWGSPWEQLYIIAARRPLAPDERIGLVITEGLGLKMNMGGTSKALAKLAGIKTHMPGMGSARNDLIERALRRILDMMRAGVERRWQADGNKGSRVTYMGLVLTGVTQPSASAQQTPRP